MFGHSVANGLAQFAPNLSQLAMGRSLLRESLYKIYLITWVNDAQFPILKAFLHRSLVVPLISACVPGDLTFITTQNLCTCGPPQLPLSHTTTTDKLHHFSSRPYTFRVERFSRAW